jgi:hypothetical protein
VAVGAVTRCAARTVTVRDQQPFHIGMGSLDMLCCMSAGVSQHILVTASETISFLCQPGRCTCAAAAAAVAVPVLLGFSIHMECMLKGALVAEHLQLIYWTSCWP